MRERRSSQGGTKLSLWLSGISTCRCPWSSGTHCVLPLSLPSQEAPTQAGRKIASYHPSTDHPKCPQYSGRIPLPRHKDKQGRSHVCGAGYPTSATCTHYKLLLQPVLKYDLYKMADRTTCNELYMVSQKESASLHYNFMKTYIQVLISVSSYLGVFETLRRICQTSHILQNCVHEHGLIFSHRLYTNC
jgi:hypothetical protein